LFLSVKDQVIPGQPSLPASEFGDGIPDFPPKRFAGDFVGIALVPGVEEISYRVIRGDSDVELMKDMTPHIFDKLTIHEEVLGSFCTGSAQLASVRPSQLCLFSSDCLWLTIYYEPASKKRS
jgi:hypothetical protein